MTSFITDYWEENIKFYLEHSIFKTTKHKSPFIIYSKGFGYFQFKVNLKIKCTGKINYLTIA